MSAKRLWYLYCDAAECPREGEPFTVCPVPDQPIQEQRREAVAHGWRRSGGKDYCEDCAPKYSRRDKP